MTVEDVKAALEAIKAVADDEEVAHGKEDALHQQVLEAIANGAPNAAELAHWALETRNIDFARWCA